MSQIEVGSPILRSPSTEPEVVDAKGRTVAWFSATSGDLRVRRVREDERVTEPLRIYSIGHSNHEITEFLALLRAHGVEVVADVRSSPWSRFAAQFNREALERSLQVAGVRYVFLGGELGGRPHSDAFYDDDGHVLYGAVAETPWFQAGLESLEEEARRSRLAMMCSEEDPTDCHRRLLVTRVLCERGVRVDHIRGTGRVVSEDELSGEVDHQQELFAEEKPWRSSRSVSHRRPRATSSVG